MLRMPTARSIASRAIASDSTSRSTSRLALLGPLAELLEHCLDLRVGQRADLRLQLVDRLDALVYFLTNRSLRVPMILFRIGPMSGMPCFMTP